MLCDQAHRVQEAFECQERRIAVLARCQFTTATTSMASVSTTISCPRRLLLLLLLLLPHVVAPAPPPLLSQRELALVLEHDARAQAHVLFERARARAFAVFRLRGARELHGDRAEDAREDGAHAGRRRARAAGALPRVDV